MTGDRVAVVGAGPAGLATARALRNEGHAVTVFERNANVGGIWDIDAIGTPMYNTAHFISSHALQTSHFSGHPFPADTPTYPNHQRVQTYLQDFAKEERLLELIRFNVSVQSATPIDGGNWQVTAGRQTEEFDALIVCSGTLWDAKMPEFKGQFDGTIRHSQTYRDPSEFAGKNVLIIGCGNSGVDIASDAARSAKSAFLSMRRGYWFLPKFIMGRPTDEFFRNRDSMPDWLTPPSLSAFLETVAGNPVDFGLPKPDHAPLASHPIMNNEVLQHIGHGRLYPRGPVVELKGNRVRFAEDVVEQIDEIICATGYRASIPFLPHDLLDYQGGSRPQLLVTTFHPDHPTLFFNGIIETNGGVFGLFDRNAHIIAKVISARRSKNTSRIAIDKAITEAEELSRTTGKIRSERHIGYIDTANLITAMEHIEAALTSNLTEMENAR